MPRDAVPWRKAKYGSLAISYHDAEVPWVELARTYWQQRLAGLCAVASSRYTLVHRGELAVSRRAYYFKRFLLRRRRDWFKHVVYGSRAIRTVRHEARLQALGFQVPRTCCVIQERRAGFVGQSAMISEACDDATPLRDWLMLPATQRPSMLAHKRAVLKALATEVGHMHRVGVCHGDLHVGNILCRDLHGSMSFIWLDNEHTQQFRVLPWRKRLRNLKRLNRWRYGITKTDRMRFWKAYCVAAQIPPHQRKAFARIVIAVAPKKKKPQGGAAMTACGMETQHKV
jgi:hypothetical protein